MNRIPLPLLLLALAGFAAPKLFVTGKELPEAAQVEGFEEPTPFSSVTVELNDAGRFFVNGGAMSLREVEAFVLRATEQRAIWLRRQGEEGYDELPTGVKGSNVSVHLRIHVDAPWRHVQWLLTALAEQKAYRTEFIARGPRDQEGRVKVWLPFDRAMEGSIEFPEDDVDETERAPTLKPGTVTVTLIAEGQKEIRWAGKPAVGYARLAWAVGKRKTDSWEKAAAWLKEEFAGREKTVEIRAHGKTPFGEVMKVVDLARRAGQERIDLYRPNMPGRGERMARQLPYPD